MPSATVVVLSENEYLALANALLVGASIPCMVAGRRAAKRRDVRTHCRFMCATLALQAVFLVVFVLRFVRFGPTELRGEGMVRVAYMAVLVTHEPIAVISVPLVVCAAVFAIAGKVPAHREVARMAYPIWLYASVTGVALWFFLYL